MHETEIAFRAVLHIQRIEALFADTLPSHKIGVKCHVEGQWNALLVMRNILAV